MAVIDCLWPSICEMFSPWLIPYYTQNMQNTPANWIRQVIANTPILLPWSENHATSAQLLFHSFVDCVQFLLDTFPACDMILGNILSWYEMHFGNVAVPRHIFTPTNSTLMMLPWSRLKPMPLHILGFYRLLQQVSVRRPYLYQLTDSITNIFICCSICPTVIHSSATFSCGSHGPRGYIAILRRGITQRDCKCCQRCWLCSWNYHTSHMYAKIYNCWPCSRRPQPIHGICWISRVLKGYSIGSLCRPNLWHCWTCSRNTMLLILASSSKIFSSKYTPIDCSRCSFFPGFYKVLHRCCHLRHPPLNCIRKFNPSEFYTSKASFGCCDCAARKISNCYPRPKASKHSIQCWLIWYDWSKALWLKITTTILSIWWSKLLGRSSRRVNSHRSKYLFLSIINSTIIHATAFRLFIDALIIWQSTSGLGNIVLVSTLNAIGSCRTFSNNIFILLEATIFNYFRHSGKCPSAHAEMSVMRLSINFQKYSCRIIQRIS